MEGGYARWGDANNDGSITITDVVQVVDRVKIIPQSLIEPQVLVLAQELEPATMNPNVLDITSTVDALKRVPYPFTITPCPALGGSESR